MTDPADRIIAYMEQHGGSANAAADALGLERRHATEARKRRKASRARAPEAQIVRLADPLPTTDPATMDAVEFWRRECRLLDEKRDMAASSESWVAFSQVTRQLHIAREHYEAAVAAAPPPEHAETDAELVEQLEALVREAGVMELKELLAAGQ